MLRIGGVLFVYSLLFKKSLTKTASFGVLNGGLNLLQGKSTLTGVIHCFWKQMSLSVIAL